MISKIDKILDDDKKKEAERKKRLQHPHMIESRKHWDWEQSYYDIYGSSNSNTTITENNNNESA